MSQFESLSKQLSPENGRRASQNSDLALLHRRHGSRLQDVNAAVNTSRLHCCDMTLSAYRPATLPTSWKKA